MDADDFQDLYKLLRGSRCATAVLDARALFVERKMERSLLKMNEARASFAESRHRVLRQDPEKTVDATVKDRDRQVKKAKRKQEKAQETLDAFDELMPVLTKMAQREMGRREQGGVAENAAVEAEAVIEQNTPTQSANKPVKEVISDRDDAGLDSYSDFDSISEGPLPKPTNEVYSAGSNGPQRPASAADFPSPFLKEFAARGSDAKLDLVGGRFGFRPVENELDVVGDGVYLIQTSKRTMLVLLPADGCEDDELRLFDLVERKRVKPVTRIAFLDLGLRRKMVLLTCSELDERGSLVPDEDSEVRSKNSPAKAGAGETMVDHATAMNDPGTVVDD
jgi:hypothetical protein